MPGSAGLVNYYAVLGVSRSASAEEIRAAYLKLAMKWHPDKAGNKEEEASARFQQIQQAYKVLSDPTRRALYDAGRYDPTSDNDEEAKLMNADVLEQMVATMDKKEEEPWGQIVDVEVNFKQQAPKKKGSSSSSSPAVCVDITFADGGSSTTAVAGASGGSRAGRRAGTSFSRHRRVSCPVPMLSARLKFA